MKLDSAFISLGSVYCELASPPQRTTHQHTTQLNIVRHHLHKKVYLYFIDACSTIVLQGKLKYKETITEGFEHMPNAFISLFRGGNIGKAVVRVWEQRAGCCPCDADCTGRVNVWMRMRECSCMRNLCLCVCTRSYICKIRGVCVGTRASIHYIPQTLRQCDV